LIADFTGFSAMKKQIIIHIATLTLALAGKAEPAPESSPSPGPGVDAQASVAEAKHHAKAIPTPHPAKGARLAAIQLYPELGKKDSAFNQLFLDLYEERLKTNPASLAAVDWPLELARETARHLHVAPAPTPAASAAKVVSSSDNQTSQQNPLMKDHVNPLEKGPYNEKRNALRGWPWSVYYYNVR
jgi:hypothetical protein